MSVGDGQAGARPSHFTAETKPWINIKRESYTWELKSDTAACSNKSVNKYQDENEKLSTSCILKYRQLRKQLAHSFTDASFSDASFSECIFVAGHSLRRMPDIRLGKQDLLYIHNAVKVQAARGKINIK